VRTWLVILGSVIAIIGAGLIVTLFFLSGGPNTTSQLTFENPGLAPHTPWPEVISLSTSSHVTLGLSWSSSGPANVSLTPAAPCSGSIGACPIGPAVFNWTLSLSGKGSTSSGNATEYILLVTNPGSGPIRFSAVVTVNYQAASPLPAWGWGLIAVGGLTLLAIGGIAVFLGLFLPGGVYGPPGEPPEPLDGPEAPPP